MGTFNVTIGVGNLSDGELTEVSAIVDTGATYTTLPASFLERLQIPSLSRRYLMNSSGERMERGIGPAMIAYGGEVWPCPVSFGSEDIYLLGATTLEIFGLMVDPVGERLLPSEGRA
jgi:predicted aspartyl protease